MLETKMAPVLSPSPRLPSLEELLAPVGEDEFFRTYWDQRHLCISREDPSFYGSLFSLADVDRAIAAACDARQENLSLIPPPDSGRPITHHTPGGLALGSVYEAFSRGDTVRLMAVDRAWPPATELAEAVSARMSCFVNINFYLTPAGQQGFPVHVDTHDVLVLQVAGSKDWFLYEPVYPLPLNTLVHEPQAMKAKTKVEAESATPLGRVVLRQGDLLYLPRGLPHKAVATDETSLHLTVGLHPLYWVDFLKAAVEAACLSHEPLRRSLPPGFARDPAASGAMEETFRGILRSLAEDSPFARTARTLTDAVLTKQTLPADGHFATLQALALIGPETVVTRRGALVCRVGRDARAATIRFAANFVRGPAAIGPALEFVRDSERFRVRELPGPLSAESKVMLVRRLIREGLLRPE